MEAPAGDEAAEVRAWAVLPSEGVWALPVGDPRSALSRIVLHPIEDGLRIDTAIGADFPFVEWREGPVRAQVGLEAGVFMDFDAGGELTFDLMTFDGRFGLPVDVAAGAWSGRLEIAHLSAHWGDGVRKDGERPTNTDSYSREFVTLTVARALGPARVYAGGRALLHTMPEVPGLAAQVGAEGEGPWVVAPYAAVDLQTAAEFAWEPQVGAQLGVRVREGRRRLRVAGVVHVGPDDTGKREGVPEKYVGVLFGFDATGAVGE